MKKTPIAESRRFRRVKLRMPAKLLVDDSIECNAMVNNLSAGGMTMTSARRMHVNENIIVYLHGVDRFEGQVVRTLGTMFSIQLNLSNFRREKIIDTLTMELARQQGVLDNKESTIERRASMRQASMSRDTLCIMEDGYSISCLIDDVSQTGLAVLMDPILEMGDVVQVGRMKAEVIRIIEGGYAMKLIRGRENAPSENQFERSRIKRARKQSAVRGASLQNISTDQMSFLDSFMKSDEVKSS